MRPRTYSRLAIAILAAEFAIVAFVFAVPGVKEFLGGTTVPAWVALVLLGIAAWAMVVLTQKKKWRPKQKVSKTKKVDTPVAPPPTAVPQGAAANPRPSLVKRTKEAVTGAVDATKAGFAVATTFFGEKTVTATVLALGAQLGVPSGTVMFMLNVVGVEDTVTAQKRQVETLEAGYSRLEAQLEGLGRKVDRVDQETGRLDRISYRDDGRISVLEKWLTSKEVPKVHVEIVDRRSIAAATPCANCQSLDMSDLLGKAVSASAKYWRGQYCAATRELTNITKAVNPLPVAVVNLKGHWLWRVKDLIGAEKCFAYSVSASSKLLASSGRDAFRSGIFGLAQTYCMRRNHPDVYLSKEYQSHGQQFASRGIDLRHADDESLAVATLRYAMQLDPGLKDVLESERKLRTEFSRICSHAIEKVMKPEVGDEPKFMDVVRGIVARGARQMHECRKHEAYNCPQPE